MSDEYSFWRDRAGTAEAKLGALESNIGAMKERIQSFKKNFGVREASNGEISIDFDKFVENLGMAQALELRKVIDEKYRISGAPGEKPKVKVPSDG
jgi:hypothetical protein